MEHFRKNVTELVSHPVVKVAKFSFFHMAEIPTIFQDKNYHNGGGEKLEAYYYVCRSIGKSGAAFKQTELVHHPSIQLADERKEKKASQPPFMEQNKKKKDLCFLVQKEMHPKLLKLKSRSRILHTGKTQTIVRSFGLFSLDH